MDAAIARALEISPSSPVRARTIDITTAGAKTGRPRRIEIYFFRVEGELYLASDATPRAWLANLRANPRFTVHLKNGVSADLPAVAEIVTDPARRRRVLREIVRWDHTFDPDQEPDRLEEWVRLSPLVRIRLDDPA
jgi:deazaflavin-dependent oxidoreductase (nitroreductase family)